MSIFFGFFFVAIYYDIVIFQSVNGPALLVFSIIFGLCLVSYLYFKQKKGNHIQLAIIFIITTWLVLQVSLIVNIEYQYQHEIGGYEDHYVDAIDTGENISLSASWLLAEKYLDDIGGRTTYGQKDAFLPNRVLSQATFGKIMSITNPVISIYFLDLNSQNKLVFLQKKGNCGEFAQAVSLVVGDVSGLNTRIIQMEGADHTLPEVYYDGEWWIFDITYTTPNGPIKTQQYATYLKDKFSSLYLSIADLRVIDGEASVLEEHGFNTSNVTILALYDTIHNSEPDMPLSNAEITVYAVEHKRDPIVFIGNTDANGKCSLVLNRDKNYVILGSNGVYNGINTANELLLKDELITIPLY